MTTPEQPSVPNSENSPGGPGNISMLNANGVGNGSQQPSYATNLFNSQTLNLDPYNQPPTMKTLIYSPDIQVTILAGDGKEYNISADVVRGQVYRVENAASTFFCEIANRDGKYTKNGGLFSRMDRIAVYMKRVNWVQVFSGYLDTVPFAQMWAGNVTLKATCTLKRLLYTYWNPNLPSSSTIFTTTNMPSMAPDAQGLALDSGIGDLLGNLVCWIGGWQPQNVHIQDFPTTFYSAMRGEFERFQRQSAGSFDSFQTMLEGYDHTAGVGSAAGEKILSTGPGLGPQVADALSYKQQVLKAVDDRGMGPSTSDIQRSYDVEQLSQTGQGSRDDATRSAYVQNSALGQNLQNQARNADAAILAFACVYAESSWLMYANRMIPESLNYHYDAIEPPHEGTSMGLFQQINQGWGTVRQRMNAYASAGMFLDALAKVSGWQNMEPAQAIATVQRNRDGAASYAPWIEIARNEVQALRAGQGKYTPQNIGGVGLSSTIAGTSAQSIIGDAVGAIGTPGVSQNTPAPGALPVAQPLRPQPDAQGAILCARSVLGRPYKWGGAGPVEFDCSGLIQYAYRSIGLEVGRTTGEQAVSFKDKVPSLDQARPGDVIQINGGRHTVMYLGGNLIIEASTEGVPVHMVPIYFSPSAISGIYRYAEYGGEGFVPFNPAAGPGSPVGTGYSGGTGSGSDGQSEPIARNLFSFMFTPSRFANTVANFFSGEKSFLDCQPLIQEVQAVAKAGLRHFASAPNGDFIAYYPDYFGVDGKPIAMTIEDIEMKDVRINLTDDALTTHVYVAGDYQMMGQSRGVAGWLRSAGVATVENESLFQRLRQVVPGGAEALTGQGILQKYGVRPLQLEFSMVGQQELEFLVACQIFMQKWAEQYATDAQFTFMPELFPGMRIAFGNTGLSVYVSEVTHTFDWEQGFTTSARIMAPSKVGGGEMVDTVVPTPADTTTPPTPTVPPG